MKSAEVSLWCSRVGMAIIGTFYFSAWSFAAQRYPGSQTMRVSIQPIKTTLADYRRVYDEKTAELVDSREGSQEPSRYFDGHINAHPEELAEFQRMIERENSTLEKICQGLQQELVRRSVAVVEGNPQLTLEVEVERWVGFSSLPPPEPEPSPWVVSVTAKQATQKLFTITFQRSSWGWVKDPHRIGITLGKRTAKKLSELTK